MHLYTKQMTGAFRWHKQTAIVRLLRCSAKTRYNVTEEAYIPTFSLFVFEKANELHGILMQFSDSTQTKTEHPLKTIKRSILNNNKAKKVNTLIDKLLLLKLIFRLNNILDASVFSHSFKTFRKSYPPLSSRYSNLLQV